MIMSHYKRWGLELKMCHTRRCNGKGLSERNADLQEDAHVTLRQKVSYWKTNGETKRPNKGNESCMINLEAEGDIERDQSRVAHNFTRYFSLFAKDIGNAEILVQAKMNWQIMKGSDVF